MKKFSSLIFSLSFILMSAAQASLLNNESFEGIADNSVTFSEKAGYDISLSLSYLLGDIVSMFLSMVGVIFLGLSLYGGYIYLMARGNEEKVDEGISTIRTAIFGLVITVGAFAIWKFIFGYLSK